MKYFFFIATILLHFISVKALKLLDNFWLIIIIFFLTLFIGTLLNFSNPQTKTKISKQIGWGLFYGSLTSIVVIVILMIWLSFNFPK